MAKLVLKDANIVFNGTDISANCASITLSTTAAEVATTAFGSTAQTRVSGLIDNSVTLSIHNDYNAIDGLFFQLVGSTAVTMVVKPNGTAVASTANPSYTFSVLTFPISGAITKAVA